MECVDKKDYIYLKPKGGCSVFWQQRVPAVGMQCPGKGEGGRFLHWPCLLDEGICTLFFIQPAGWMGKKTNKLPCAPRIFVNFYQSEVCIWFVDSKQHRQLLSWPYMVKFFHSASWLIKNNWTDSPIHTLKIDEGLLPAMFLYFDRQTSQPSEYTDHHCSRLAAYSEWSEIF